MAISNTQTKKAAPRRSNAKAGFTLIEMLVVVAIFAIVASVLLFNYSDFSTSVAIRNLSAEIGLSVRQAQSYATSVRSLAGTNGARSDMFPAYGISFSVNPTGPAFDPTNNNFVLFADISPDASGKTNDLYENNGTCGTPAVGAECVQSFGIQNGDVITSLCTAQTSAATCMTARGTVNVVFRRPSPDAEIYVVGNPQPQSYVYVTVMSPKGLKRVIKIYTTGQIDAQ